MNGCSFLVNDRSGFVVDHRGVSNNDFCGSSIIVQHRSSLLDRTFRTIGHWFVQVDRGSIWSVLIPLALRMGPYRWAMGYGSVWVGHGWIVLDPAWLCFGLSWVRQWVLGPLGSVIGLWVRFHWQHVRLDILGKTSLCQQLAPQIVFQSSFDIAYVCADSCYAFQTSPSSCPS